MFSHFTAWRYRCALIAAICATVAADLLGQVNHVINLPDDPVPDSVHFYTQFNIYEGGALPDLYNLGVGLFPALYVDVNVLGGTVGRRLSLTKGSRLDLFSGRVGTNLGAGDGNVVTIRGGGLGNEFSARAGSEVLVYGSDFRFNGQPVAGLHDVGDRVSVNGMSDGVLTGYLADGTPFAFSGYRDFIADGVLTVELTESTHAEPTLIQVPAEAAPDSVRDGQVLIVDRQAQLPDLFQVGPGSVVIARNDAMLGHELTAVAASVLIDDSRLGALATFLDKSVLRATNSSIDRGLVVADRSTATIDRSPIDGYLWVTDQGVVSLNDSSVNGDLRVQRSSTLDATASNVAGRVTVSEGSTVRFSGAQIQLGLDVLSDSVVYLGGDVVIDQRFGQNSVSGNSDLVLNGATLHGDTVIRDGRFRLHGGTLDTLVAASDGEVSIDGGVVRGLYSSDSATLTISGGSVTESIPYREPIPTGRGLLRLTGSEFRFNGQTIDPVNATSGYERFSIAPGDFVSGVFVDGTPFGFRSMSGVLGGFVELASVEVPESPPILHAANDQLGYGIRDGQTLFVDSGGRIPDDFKAGFGSTVHIGPGGVLGENFHAFGSEVHIHGGDLSNSVFAEYESRIFVHDGAVGATIFAGRDSSVIVDGGRITYLDLEAGSHAEILGGQVDEFHTTYDSSMVVAGGAHDFSTVRRIRGGDITLRGSEFRINGQLSDVLNVVGSPTELDVADDAVVTGLLADGTPFLYTGDDIYRPTRLLLEAVELLPVDMPVIVASVDPVPTGLRDGQRLIVDQGSHIPGRFHAGWGSTVRVEKGGVMNGNMLALGSELELDGGQIATLELRDGSSLTVIDGDAQVSLVDETSHLAIYGGTLRPPRGSAGLSLRGTAEVVGGIVPARMRVNSGGMASIRGGRIVGALTAFGDARVSMEGYAWHINGVPVEAPDEIGANIPISVTPGAVLTGILSDGTPLLLRNAFVADGSLTLVNTAPVARPSMIVASADPIPLGIHDGQTMIVDDGATVGEYFLAGQGSRLVVTGGGRVDAEMQAEAAEIVIAGGALTSVRLYQSSQLLMTKGEISDFLSLESGSGAAIGGGFVSSLSVRDASVAMVAGGQFESIGITDGGHLSISGGEALTAFRAASGSDIEFVGTEFFLDDVAVDGLTDIGASVIETREGVLRGTLLDGSEIKVVIASSVRDLSFYVARDATLRLTRGNPFPPGDFNHDGTVDAADFTIWKDDFGSTRYLSADANRNGIVDAADFTIWKDHFGQAQSRSVANGHPVPEPESLLLLLCGVIGVRKWKCPWR